MLRSGAVLGGGLLASAAAGDRVAADRDWGLVGYTSRSSYQLLTGDRDVDCVDGRDGWGGGFYLHGEAEDGDGDTGISVSLPAGCSGDGPDREHVAQLVTATERTDLDGGPNGHGPWREDCGSWVFVADGDAVETGTNYRVTELHGASPPAACHEGVTATDSDGGEIGAPMDLVRISFAPVADPDEWTQAAKLSGHDEFDRFGASVAVDGSRAVVGARDDEASDRVGSASVYTQSAGFWYPEAKLRAGDGPGEAFGSDVAIHGDTAVVAATGEAPGESAVYVFDRSGGDWRRAATLTTDADEQFGSAVAIDGETVVVGADGAGAPDAKRRGAAYVFTPTADGWTQQARLTAAAPGTVGSDVAVAGDTAVVGADTTDGKSAPHAVAAYVFTRSDGDWDREATLTADVDRIGGAVAIDGDTVLAGVGTDATTTDRGRRPDPVYVFTRAEGGWGRQAKLAPADGQSRGRFGHSIALDTDTAVVGSDVSDGKKNTARGGAYVFARSEGEWHQRRKLTADDGEGGDRFGISVALDGGYTVFGASGAAPNGPHSGAAYVFED